MKKLSRRRFLKLGGAALATGAIVGSGTSLALRRFQVVAVTNPLEDYPNRDWESVYRDQYAYDDSFTTIASPSSVRRTTRTPAASGPSGETASSRGSNKTTTPAA